MAEHRISLVWSRDGAPFERNRYPRDHTLRFDGGQTLLNSAAPDYAGSAAASNPEELLLASLSSCHMLTFLAVAANRGYVIDSYEDQAVAELGKTVEGKVFVAKTTLAPQVVFAGGKQPSPEDYAKLHERAHAACFIANSIRSEFELRL